MAGLIPPPIAVHRAQEERVPPVAAKPAHHQVLHGVLAAQFAHSQSQRLLVVKLLLRSLFPLFLALLLVFYSVNRYQCDDGVPTRKSEMSSYRASLLMPIQQVRGGPAAEYELPVHGTEIRATSGSYIKEARKLRRPNVDRFSKIFEGLLDEGLLKNGQKVLCLGAGAGEEIVALKEKGVTDVIGVDLMPSSRDSIRKGSILTHRFADETFDFEFSAEFDNVHHPALFVAEIERTLKAGGLAVMHVSLATWRDRFMASEFDNRIQPVTLLFHHSEIVYVSTAYAPGLDTIIVFKKSLFLKVMQKAVTQVGSNDGDHSISEVNQPEPLLEEEGRKSTKEHIGTAVYPDQWNQDIPSRSVYIDAGGSDSNFSMGSWLKTRYPKDGHAFNVLLVEAANSFQTSYVEVSFMQYAAWETEAIKKIFHTSNGQSHFHGSAGIESQNGETVALTLQGLDFADWLKEAVVENDFVVVKMDMKGTQFDFVSRMLEKGTIFFIDEIFLVCHHHMDWKGIISRAANDRPYSECLARYHTLLSNGISLHPWW